MVRIIKTITALFMTLILIFSPMAFVFPTVLGVGSAPAPPASGDWIISSPESYQDTELVVTGDLVVQSGGSLTLRNVTLRMNVTATANPLTIKVEAGGTLNIWDADGDPTTADGSLITDSTYDTDDLSGLDYRYYFNVEKDGILKLNNSVVEECGDPQSSMDKKGLYIQGNNTVVENTTFRSCGYGVVVLNANNTLIKSVNATNVYKLMYALNSDYLTIDHCNFNLGNVQYGIQVTSTNNILVSNNNVTVTYEPFIFQTITKSSFINNTAERTSTSSLYRTADFISCNEIFVDGLTLYGYSYLIQAFSCQDSVFSGIDLIKPISYLVRYWGMHITSSTNVTLKDSQFLNLYEDGLKITSATNIRVSNCTFDNFRNNGIYVYKSSNVVIENNTIGNCSKDSSYGGLKFYDSDDSVIKYNWIGYNTNKDIYLQLSDRLDIINNTIGTYFNDKAGIYISGAGATGSYYNYIAHNRILKIKTGIYLHFGDYNTFEDNYIEGQNDGGEGIRVSSGKNNEFINCTIKDFYWGTLDYQGAKFINTNFTSNELGIVGTNSRLENVSVYANDREGLTASGLVIAKNSSFHLSGGSFKDVKANTNAEIILINCTYGDENIAAGAKLWVKWWVDLYVNDTNGPVPGAVVRVFNGTDDVELNATAGGDGNITLALTEKLFYNTWIDFNPHNLTAEAAPDVGNVTPRPVITTNSNYTITFPGDTNPPPPWDLRAVSQSDDVMLTWDYYTLPDLVQFEIFRSTDPLNFGSTPIGTAGVLERSYLDNDGADDWTTYYYQVRANDTAGNLGYPSNTAKCGDWIVSAGNKSVVSGKSIDLNGTLVIEDGGTLEFVSTHLKFNSTYNGQFGLTVLGGGVIEIVDSDDDADTTGDASNISALDPNVSTYFIVNQDGILYMNNSQVYGVGYPPTVLPFDGVHVRGNGSIIRGNHFMSTDGTDAGLIIDLANGVTVMDNYFDRFSNHALILSYAVECVVDNNTITGSDSNGIDMDRNLNVTVSNNTITDCVMGIYTGLGNGNVIENNYVHANIDYGIRAFFSTGLLLYNNTVEDHMGDAVKDVGIYIDRISDSIVKMNRLDNNEKGIFANRISTTDILSNDVQDTNREGITVTRCTDTLLENNIINNSGITGIYIDQCIFNITITGGNTSGAQNGFLIDLSNDVLITDVVVWNNLNGMVLTDSQYIVVIDCRINASSNYGISADSSSAPTLYSLWLENCTISNPEGEDVQVMSQAFVFLINITLPYEQVEFSGPFSKVGVFWYSHIYVEDMFGQPAAGANVTIKQAGGQALNLQTDGNGYILWRLLHDKTMLLDGNFTSNPYTFSAVKGNHSGTNTTNIDGFTTVTIKLENKAPSALNVQLTPASPSTLNSLTVSFDYSDPENDPEFPFTIRWFADGVEQSTLADQKTVLSTSTQKGQNWFARITVYDGADYSVIVDSNIVTIKNTRPAVSGVAIGFASPSSTTDIGVSYSFNDVDNDNEGDTLVNWFVDRGSGWVDSSLSGQVLNYSHTKKGESWKARVLPHDGEEYGDVVESNTVLIGNSPPQALSIEISPEAPTSMDSLSVYYTYFDIDDDPEDTGLQKWYKDTGSGFVDSGITDNTVSSDKLDKGDRWKCEYTPYDGTEYGTSIMSEPVTIGNSPPSVANIIISPVNPTRLNDLVVDYNYSDPDLDAEDKNASSIKWFVKKKGVSGFAFFSNDWSISGADLTKGDEWMCEIKPADGEDSGEFTQSLSTVIVVNAPPVASDLSITPSDPRQGMSLSANYMYFDIDGDPEDTGNRAIIWYKEDDQVSDYDNMISIPENVIRKGETWYFRVRPHDGEDYGSGQQSPSFKVSADVKIGNTAPFVNNTFIQPSEPTSGDNLSAVYNYFDIDGDMMEKSEIEWYRNEVHIDSFNNLPFISSDMTFKGDVWYFKLRVFDGLAYSDWMTSPPKLVVNSPPSITFHSPDSITPVINENEEITFLVEASDLDKDSLTYLWFVNDLVKNLGKVFTLETDFNSNRWYDVEIEVSDGTEKKVGFIWNVTVNDVNRLPTITIQTPEGKRDIEMTTLDSQEFIIVKDDKDEEDEDGLSITWYLDDIEALSGEDRYVYQPSAASAGDHEIKVEVSDGKDTISESWNITVAKEDVGSDREELAGYSYDFWGLIIAILSAIVAAVMFMFGVLRVRKKKGKLKEYMDKIESIKDSDLKTSGKEKELVELKRQVKSEFSQGLVSENHYIILEREIDDALGEVRKTIVGRKVSMPGHLKSEVEGILDDGVVTKKEYVKAKKMIDKSEELSTKEKEKLDRMMKKWTAEEESRKGREGESMRVGEGESKRGGESRRGKRKEEREVVFDDEPDDDDLDFLDGEEEEDDDDDW